MDFANWDDFFDIPEYHNGLDVLLEEGYSIIISFTGNRWYSTIIPLNETTQNLLHVDYHCFWDTALNEDRTFLISEVTSASYPVEIDWYEMRRRINYRLREDVDFAYGPIGVLIPMVDYRGSGKLDSVSNISIGLTIAPAFVLTATTLFSANGDHFVLIYSGWFHCHQDEPTDSPTESATPTASKSPSLKPSTTTFPSLTSFPASVSSPPTLSLQPTRPTGKWGGPQ